MKSLKKLRKKKIEFKKKNLKTLTEELNMMIKILQNKFQENNWRFIKDLEVDNNSKKKLKKFKKRKISKQSVQINFSRSY